MVLSPIRLLVHPQEDPKGDASHTAKCIFDMTVEDAKPFTLEVYIKKKSHRPDQKSAKVNLKAARSRIAYDKNPLEFQFSEKRV